MAGWTLLCAMPVGQAWHRNAIDAAREAGVQLLVRSSILGADRAVARLTGQPARSLDDLLGELGPD